MTQTWPRTNRELLGSLGLIDAFALGTTMLLIGTIPVEYAATVSGVSLARLAGVLAFAAVSLVVLRDGLRIADGPVFAAILAYLSWAVLSMWWTGFPDVTMDFLARMAQQFLMVMVIWQVVTTPLRFRWALAALAFGGAFGGLLSANLTVSAKSGVARFALGDPNDFGIALAVSLMAVAYLVGTSRTSKERLLYLLMATLISIGILRTASRTAVIAVVFAGGLLLVTKGLRTFRGAVATIASLVIAVGIATQLVSQDSLDRVLNSADDVEAGDFNSRTTYWALAGRFLNDHPLTGVGGGAFKATTAEYGDPRVAHSVLFGTLAELGVVGLALFAMVVLTAAWAVLRTVPRPLAVYLLALAVVWTAGALTLTLEPRKVTWMLVALASTHAWDVARRTDRPPRRASAFSDPRRRPGAAPPATGGTGPAEPSPAVQGATAVGAPTPVGATRLPTAQGRQGPEPASSS